MKKLIIFTGLAVAFIAILGCDEQARELATQAATILDQRSVQVSRKIATEAEAYSEYSAKAAEDEYVLTTISRANERAERGSDLEIGLIEGSQPVSRWRMKIAEYAHADYEIQKAMYFSELNAESQFLRQYNQVRIDQDKVDALQTLLQALAKKPQLKEEATSLANFAKQTKDDFDQKVCDDLKSKQDAGSKQLFQEKKCK